MVWLWNRRTMLLGALLVAGLCTRAYTGPGAGWVNNYLGGVLYEVFWCVLAGSALARVRPASICLYVFGGTCLVEVSQLWHPSLLEAARATFLGGVLLGTSFDIYDFPHYMLGCLVGFGLLMRLNLRYGRRRHGAQETG